MADTFKPGDVVILKSGGFPMTIGKEDGDKFFCYWQAGQEIKTAMISKVAVEHSSSIGVRIV